MDVPPVSANDRSIFVLVTAFFAYAGDYEVVAVRPHDRHAFTQGLESRDGALYEGTGRYGTSELRKVRLETGEVLQRTSLDAQYFGEGITVWRDKIVQLTWRSETGFVHDRRSRLARGGVGGGPKSGRGGCSVKSSAQTARTTSICGSTTRSTAHDSDADESLLRRNRSRRHVR